MGVTSPKGILLTGPPVNGKTTIAKVIARTAGLSFFVVKTNEDPSKVCDKILIYIKDII